ncbi:MAG: hypothetical protein Q8P11_03120, partial [bacterium]|nr:hypothetical protein [bacterium]
MSVHTHTTTPFILTVFGASGDLAHLKIFPALYELMEQNMLPRDFWIVGYARTKMTKSAFHKSIKESIRHVHGTRANTHVIMSLLSHVQYFPGAYRALVDFEKYHAFLTVLKKNISMVHLAYFSVPPSAFEDIIRNLALSRSSRTEDIRLILEKPFGTSCHSATALFHTVSQYFDERDVYLLDHYLGKTSVRSILNLRHTNRILSHMMRGAEISNIQITKFESYGVSERGGYFDSVGIIKDMIQSHLLQLLALVTMDIPVVTSAERLQKERLAVISALECVGDSDHVVIGQYKGYTKEAHVAPRSRAETFAALRLFINREEWYNIPIYLRTGKSIYESHTYIVIELKRFAFQDEKEEPNRLVFEISP